MSAAQHTPVYVAKVSCGCVIAACVDDPSYRRDTAKDVGGWVRKGYAVERRIDAPPAKLFARCGDHADLDAGEWLNVVKALAKSAKGGAE